MRILFWGIRVWALCVGSGVLPCVVIIAVLRRMVTGEMRRELIWVYLHRALGDFALAAVALALPVLIEDRPLVMRPGLEILFIAMAFRFTRTVLSWRFMFYLTGLKLPRRS